MWFHPAIIGVSELKKNISEKLGSRAEGGDSDDCDSSEDFR